MWRAAFLPWPTPTVTVRSLGTMSPPANTPGQPVISDVDTCTVPSRSNSTPGTSRRNAVSRLLAERQDHRVGGERLEPAGRLRVAGLVELHHLDLQLRAVEGRDRPQPVDPHALALGVLGLLVVGRHLLAGAPVDDQRLVRAQPAGDPGGVHRRVAAAVDRDAAADHRPLAGGDAAQERHRVDDPARRPGPGCRPAWTGARRPRRRPRRSRPRAARRRGPRPGGPQVIRTPSAAIRSSSPSSTSRGSR